MKTTLNETLAPLLLHLGVRLSDEQLAHMDDYWYRVKNAPLNLTAIRTDEGAALLHFADSLAPLAFGLIPQNASVIDVGTGGGFPAVPLAAARPDLRVTALDSTKKKLTFVEENANCSNLRVLHARAEEAGRGALRQQFDLSCARAVAPLSVVLEYLSPFVRVGGCVIAYKADLSQEERADGLAAASLLGLKALDFPVLTLGDGADAQTRTLCVFEKTAATPAKYPRAQAKQRPLGVRSDSRA